MTQRQTDGKRAGEAARTLATGLWLPALLLAGLLFSYLPAFHHPAPHHVSIAVAASPAATARLQHELGVAAPGGFTLRPTVGAAGARAAVLHHSAVAAYVPGGPHPLDLLYLFLLTQAVSLTAYGLVPLFGGFFPGIAITLFILLGVPSSGGAIPVQLVPGFFSFLHPILPHAPGPQRKIPR